jgi:hypothetical protein
MRSFEEILNYLVQLYYTVVIIVLLWHHKFALNNWNNNNQSIFLHPIFFSYTKINSSHAKGIWSNNMRDIDISKWLNNNTPNIIKLNLKGPSPVTEL